MKRILMMTVALFGTAALAAGPPVGTFEGTGSWQAADGSKGEYQTTLTITPEALITDVEYETEHEGKRQERHTMNLKPTQPGFFDIVDEAGKIVGELSCMGRSCTYRLQADGLVVHEALTLQGSELHKFGSKQIGNFKLAWNEVLHAR